MIIKISVVLCIYGDTFSYMFHYPLALVQSIHPSPLFRLSTDTKDIFTTELPTHCSFLSLTPNQIDITLTQLRGYGLVTSVPIRPKYNVSDSQSSTLYTDPLCRCPS